MKTTVESGKEGELIAIAYLVSQGFAILETNWRAGRAEIDIIAQSGQMLVFLEVKLRSSNQFGAPEMAVNAQKQENLIAAAEAYLELVEDDLEVRFDIISIVNHEKNPEIRHIEDAFRG